jgi:hypothetical protein
MLANLQDIRNIAGVTLLLVFTAGCLEARADNPMAPWSMVGTVQLA